MNNQDLRKAQGGFTLTELMVAVAIVGLAAAMSVPNFRGMIQHNRMLDATRTMAGEMLELRTRAVRDNKTYWLVFSATTPTTVTAYEIHQAAACTAATYGTPASRVQSVNMADRYPGVTAEVSADPACIQFTSSGFFPDTPWIRLRRTDNANDMRQICLRISRTVKIQETTAACT